jgi:hypothetical protein
MEPGACPLRARQVGEDRELTGSHGQSYTASEQRRAGQKIAARSLPNWLHATARHTRVMDGRTSVDRPGDLGG